MPAFRGFPPEALEFLRELEANNDRDWFKANRARYDEHLVAPTRALGEDLAGLGRPHLFRPWNDTRFHARPPVKEHVGLAVGYEGAGGFYVELSLDGLLVAGRALSPGARSARPHPPRDRRGRSAAPLDAGDRPRTRGRARTQRARARARAARVSGRPSAHRPAALQEPHGDAPPRARSWLRRPKAGRTIRDELDAATPLVRWVREHAGPTQHAPRS